MEYYTELQKQCDDGHRPSLLDPLQVSMDCITDVLGFNVTLDELVPIYSVTAEDLTNTQENSVIKNNAAETNISIGAQSDPMFVSPVRETELADIIEDTVLISMLN